MMDTFCEVNGKGTRGKNGGNEVLEKKKVQHLTWIPNELIEANEEILPYAEED